VFCARNIRIMYSKYEKYTHSHQAKHNPGYPTLKYVMSQFQEAIFDLTCGKSNDTTIILTKLIQQCMYLQR